jgi:hypothetical protein
VVSIVHSDLKSKSYARVNTKVSQRGRRITLRVLREPG